MHVFQNLKTQEQFKLEEDKNLAKKRGLTLEEYRAIKKKEHEEEYKRIYMEDFKRLGITEEEYLTRENKRKRKETTIRHIKDILFAISVLLMLLLLYYGIPEFLSSSEIGKGCILIVGLVFVLGLVAFYLGAPVFLTIWGFLGKGRGNHYRKAIVVLIMTLLVVGLVLHTCGSMGNGGTEIYEPGKLRPDKF